MPQLEQSPRPSAYKRLHNLFDFGPFIPRFGPSSDAPPKGLDMTTFATPFTSFTNMQTEEDFMEVSNDPERRNAMEEDNLDIDLDLGDDPQIDHDEDSMMDDGPTGQDGDQDQAMDDDYQEQGDQDDEILDYIDDQAPVAEIPMAEDAPSWEEPASDMQNLFTADVVHETPALSSFATQSSVVTAPPQLTDSLQAQADKSFTAIAEEPADDVDNLESRRTLYDDEPSSLGPRVDLAPKLETQENGSEQKTTSGAGLATNPVAELEDPSHEPKHAVAHGEDLTTLSQDEAGNAPASADHEALNAGPSSATDASTKDPDPVNPKESDFTAKHEFHKEVDENTVANEHLPTDTTDDQAGSDQHPTNMPETEPIHPILVMYLGQQMSLFPPTANDKGTPETYLLPDVASFDQPISSFLDVCRSALSESLADHEDVEITFPSFDFTVRRYDPQAAEYTLRHIAELCIQFQQCDGVEHPRPLNMKLDVASSLAGRMSYLYDLAGQSKGLKYVEDLLASNFDDGLGEGDFVDHAQEAQDTFGDDHADQDWNPGVNEEPNTEDHIASAISSGKDAQSTTDADDANQTERVAASIEMSAKGTASDSQANIVASKEEPLPDDDDGREDHQESTHDEPAGPFNEERFETENEQEHEDDAYGGDQGANENVQTAEEIDFDDDEWEIEETTDTDDTNIADTQRSAFEQPSEVSQSLHSAVEPEANTAHPDSKETLTAQSKGDDEPADVQPEASDSSSTTFHAAEKSQLSIATDDADDDDDIFGDDDEYAGLIQTATDGNIDDFEDEIDFDDDEPQAKSPTLKRIRSEVDQAGDEVDDDEDHLLKRSRSG